MTYSTIAAASRMRAGTTVEIPVPAPAPVLSYSLSGETVTLNWTASNDVVEYAYYKKLLADANWTLLGRTGSLTATATQAEGTTFEYRVDAENASGITQSNVVSVTREAAPSLDPDYQAVLDFATANGIALPDAAQQTADDNFIKAYKAKANGAAWAKDDVFFRPASTASIAFRLICWKRKVQMTQHGSLIWDSNGVPGVEGNGVNGYINPMLNLSTATNYKMNDAGIMFYGLKNPQELKSVVGAYTGDSSVYVLYTPNMVSGNGRAYMFLNNGLIKQSTTPATVGLNGLYRTPPNNKLQIAGGDIISEELGVPATAVLNNTPYILARHRIDLGGGAADLYSSEKIKFLTIGASKKDLHVELNTLTY